MEIMDGPLLRNILIFVFFKYYYFDHEKLSRGEVKEKIKNSAE